MTLYRLGIFLVFLSGMNALAQDVQLSVTGGGNFMQAGRSFMVAGDEFESDFKAGPALGIRGSVGVTDSVAIEAGYSVGKSDLRIRDLADAEERRFTTNLHEIAGNVKYYLGAIESRSRAFITAGMGMAVFSPSDEAKAAALAEDFLDQPVQLSSSNRWSINFGTGVESRLNRWFGVRADLREHLMMVPRFGVPETGTGQIYPVHGITHNVEVSGGVVFSLW